MQSDSEPMPDAAWEAPSTSENKEGYIQPLECGGVQNSQGAPNVRRAGVCDLPQICAFTVAMAKETEDLSLKVATVARGVAEVFDDASKGCYFVLTEGGRTRAQLMITYEWSDWRAGRVWWVQSVYVDPEHRRKGYYRMMYEHIRRLAKLDGAVGLRLYAVNGNVDAHSTYEALGMSNHYKVYEEMFP